MNFRPFWSSLTLILLFAAGPAGAAGIRNCSEPAATTLMALETTLAGRLEALTQELPRLDLGHAHLTYVIAESRPTTRLRDRRYHDYHQRLVAAFESMEARTHKGLSLECRQASREPLCRDGQNQAFVRFFLGIPGDTVFFCPAFFALGESEQLEVLLHELSHSVAWTDDLALGWQQGAKTDITRAAGDAYHLQAFAAGDAEQVIKTQIWQWNWPLGHQKTAGPRY